MSILAWLNAFADRVEQKMPRWFRWETRGNWITWIHHLIWALLFTGAGAALGLALGDWHAGALCFSIAAALFYIVREGVGFWQARRFYLDGFMDQVGPVLNALAWWLL